VTQPRRGDVWWVEVPEGGRRPALVLTRDAAISVVSRVLVAPASRTIRRIPTEVFLDEGDGMPAPCVLTLDGMTVVSKGALSSWVTALSPERMAQVCTAMGVAVDCG
jgi:mRNA interferase MazF